LRLDRHRPCVSAGRVRRARKAGARDRAAMSERVFVEHDEADAFARALLAAHGVPKKDAATVAACLVRADLRGVDTHGLVRLPGYLDRVRRGLVNPKPRLFPKRVTPAAAALDGQNGFGFVIGTRALAEKRGERIPSGYALDDQGRPTTDPTEALTGVMLPIGSHKGSGLSMLMDIFGGVLSGVAYAGDVADQYKAFDRPQNVGHFFLA